MAPASPTLDCLSKRAPRAGYAYRLAENKLALADAGGLRVGVDEKAMSASFVITDETPDRVGDVVIAAGISLDNFRKNPVGFFNHQQFPLPIGKWEDPQGRCTVIIEDRRATGTLYFSQRSKEAAQVFDLVREDILRATSIGFNPLEPPVQRRHNDPNPNSLESGLVFPAIDLLEVSVVGVPANPGASRLRGWIDHNRPGPQLKAALLPWCDPKKAWCPGYGPGTKEEPAMATTTKAKKGRKKDMAESSGADGGYVAEGMVADGEAQDAATNANRPQVVDMVRAVMEHHAADAHPDGPHDAYVSHDGKSVHHHHHKDADPEHLATVKEDLSQIDGVESVTQGHEPPAGDGMAKEFPQEHAAEADGSTHPDEVDPRPEPPGETGETKGGCACKAKRKAKSMPADDDEEDSSVVTKDDGAAATASGDAGTATVSAPMPHGAEAAQHLCEYLEGCVGRAEPETAEFFTAILEQVREWAQERYPETPFGGEEEGQDGEAEPAGAEADEAADREASREAMDEYRRGGRVGWRKRYMNRCKLRVVKEAGEHLDDMAGLEHGTEITRTHKAACAHHAKRLKDLADGFSGGGHFDDGDDFADDGAAAADGAKSVAPAWTDDALAAIAGEVASLNGRLDGVGRELRRTTGRGL